MSNAKTTKELYEALICNPDLHSVPELHDNIIIWHLYTNAYLQAYCENGDAIIDVIGGSVYQGSLMHWHPDEDDILEQLYAMGKKGNILVLKKSLLGTELFYMGAPDQYPLSDKRGWYLGKKKWGGGRLIYLEQKP